MRMLFVCGALLLLAGCSAQNTNMSTLQFSGEAIPFPDDYRSRAAAALAGQVDADTSMQISKPQPALGASAFGPQRWYACVRGVPNSAPARTTAPVWDLVEEWIDPAARRDELVLFFNETGIPSVRKSAGSPLCRESEFEAFTLAMAHSPAG